MFKHMSLFKRYKYRYRETPSTRQPILKKQPVSKRQPAFKKQPSYNTYKQPNNMTLQHKLQGILAIIIIITLFFLVYIQLDREVMPSVRAMAKLRATTVATQAINEAVNESLMNIQVTEGDFLSYDYNDQGELVSWNVNAILINTLCADVVEKATEKLQNIGGVAFKIPLGNLTGSHIFANLGPDIGVEVMPLGAMKVDYKNQISSTGINQINHTVWLDIETIIQVVVPLFTDQVVVNRRVMLVDKMLSGKVPPSYVNIPEESILDVAPGDVEEDLLP